MSAHQVWVKEEPGCFSEELALVKQEPASDYDAEETTETPDHLSVGCEIQCEPDIDHITLLASTNVERDNRTRDNEQSIERASENSQGSNSTTEKKKRNFTVPRFSCCICDICGKTFPYKSSLVRHIQVHMDKKLYPCKYCNKQYTSNFNYKEHTRTHTGQRHFNCNVCKRTFTRKSYLIRHQKIHTNDEVYKCAVCEKQFTVRSYLVTHMRLHTGESHVCEICNKKFKVRSYLVSHRLIHKKAKFYTCKVCDERFERKSDLDKHKCFSNPVKPSPSEEYIIPNDLTPSDSKIVSETIEIKIEPDP